MTILEDKYNKGKYNKDHKIEPQRNGRNDSWFAS